MLGEFVDRQAIGCSNHRAGIPLRIAPPETRGMVGRTATKPACLAKSVRRAGPNRRVTTRSKKLSKRAQRAQHESGCAQLSKRARRMPSTRPAAVPGLSYLRFALALLGPTVAAGTLPETVCTSPCSLVCPHPATRRATSLNLGTFADKSCSRSSHDRRLLHGGTSACNASSSHREPRPEPGPRASKAQRNSAASPAANPGSCPTSVFFMSMLSTVKNKTASRLPAGRLWNRPVPPRPRQYGPT